MSSNESPLQHAEVQSASWSSYLPGYLIGLALMGGAYWAASSHGLGSVTALTLISVCAGVAIVAQLVLLLHLDLSKDQIWNTIALVLTVPLFILAIGLTVWMFQGLYTRTMVTPPAAVSAPAQ